MNIPDNNKAKILKKFKESIRPILVYFISLKMIVIINKPRERL
jgi:hypothetical protein